MRPCLDAGPELGEIRAGQSFDYHADIGGILRNLLRLLLCCALILVPFRAKSATTCSVLHHPASSEADKALQAADYAKAADLYRAGLAVHPGDVDLTAGLVRALLHQQKVQEASDTVAAALTASPGTAALISLRGEVEYRSGKPWASAQSASEASRLDLCNPRNHLLLARLSRLNSLYATARHELETAHQLDPDDAEIRIQWIHTLPLKQAIAELDSYLSVPRGDDEEQVRQMKLALEHMRKLEDQPQKGCRLVSETQDANIPFITLMRDPTHIRAFGLEVKFNDHAGRLEIDTGASGLLVSRSVAQHSGLKPFSESEFSGIGDQGPKGGYSAYADSIRIGGLEFHDCPVRVVDSRNVSGDVDGLIGMDVFSNFLVTLDFPMRKLLLGPLPKRPGDTAAPAPALNTQESSSDNPGEAKDASANAAKDTAGEKPPDDTAVATPKPKPHGPYDRYVAPEMKDYTPVYRVGHQLLLPASVNGGPPRLFILDTGAFTTIVSPQTAAEAGKLHSDDRMRVHGISGEVNKVYSVDNLTFSFAHFSQKAREVTSFDTSHTSKNVGIEVSGFLGATTLDLMTMHIDYRDGLVKFEYDPNRGYRPGH
jgi:predicted aspartyl protease/tetratricopeptide (TPR) repeat protein